MNGKVQTTMPPAWAYTSSASATGRRSGVTGMLFARMTASGGEPLGLVVLSLLSTRTTAAALSTISSWDPDRSIFSQEVRLRLGDFNVVMRRWTCETKTRAQSICGLSSRSTRTTRGQLPLLALGDVVAHWKVLGAQVLGAQVLGAEVLIVQVLGDVVAHGQVLVAQVLGAQVLIVQVLGAQVLVADIVDLFAE